MAGDCSRLNFEGNLARRNLGDLAWGAVIVLESIGGVVVGPNIGGFHASELVPLLPLVLVSFYVFPRESDRKSGDNAEDFVYHVIFWSECCARKHCLCIAALFYSREEAFVVRGDSNPRRDGVGGSGTWEVVELVEAYEFLEED